MTHVGMAVLENDILRVEVSSAVGGSITSIFHKPLGKSVLGRVPWDPVAVPEPGFAAKDEQSWLTRYTGGWPLMFPNAGNACVSDGLFHGFHGEASISPWHTEVTPDRIRLTRRFFSVPVQMTRELTLDGDVLCLHETAVSDGMSPVRVIWGQHITFGSDLLMAPVIIETGAKRVLADASDDPPANPLLPGATGDWPIIAGKSGPCDLSRPQAPWSSYGYLTDFETKFVSIRRIDGAVGAAISWQGDVYDCLWFWCELGGTLTPPWHGRGQLIGLEPCSTRSGLGLADAVQNGVRLVELVPGKPTTASVRLHVFHPDGPVKGVDPSGRACANTQAGEQTPDLCSKEPVPLI